MRPPQLQARLTGGEGEGRDKVIPLAAQHRQQDPIVSLPHRRRAGWTKGQIRLILFFGEMPKNTGIHGCKGGKVRHGAKNDASGEWACAHDHGR
jgi:hypothetical protein